MPAKLYKFSRPTITYFLEIRYLEMITLNQNELASQFRLIDAILASPYKGSFVIYNRVTGCYDFDAR